MNDRHTILIVEDDVQIADILAEIVASLGYASMRAGTLEEVRAAIAKGSFCCALLDMQIPAYAGAKALAGSGETALALLRKHEPRTEQGKHVLPIIVVTGYSKDPDFVFKMADAGADAFIAKPFDDRVDAVLEKIRGSLARAGRADHAQCLAAASTMAAGLTTTKTEVEVPAPVTVRLILDGARVGRRTGLLVDGERIAIQDLAFTVLLGFVAARINSGPDAWPTREEIGRTVGAVGPSRVRTALRAALPEGFDPIQAGGGGLFRLHPGIIIERVDWTVLAKHPDEAVKKIARAQIEREAKKRP